MLRRRVSFHTLGCKLNFSESSTLARQFAEGGFERVAPTAEADICVINSCSVTEHADKKCRNLIRRLHRRNPEAIIAVTGCYAQLKPQEIAAIDGVDIVLSNNVPSFVLSAASGSLFPSTQRAIPAFFSFSIFHSPFKNFFFLYFSYFFLFV